jgi:hypothetical protein
MADEDRLIQSIALAQRSMVRQLYDRARENGLPFEDESLSGFFELLDRPMDCSLLLGKHPWEEASLDYFLVESSDNLIIGSRNRSTGLGYRLMEFSDSDDEFAVQAMFANHGKPPEWSEDKGVWTFTGDYFAYHDQVTVGLRDALSSRIPPGGN